MNENEKYISEQIVLWVWSGFESPEDAHESLDDILEDDVDEKMLRDLIDSEFTKKVEQEKLWPEITDCDKLDNAFGQLNDMKIIAIQNAGYTSSDGIEEVGKVHKTMPKGTFAGYVFYHGQDMERAICGDGLSLSFGDMKDTKEGKIKVAEIITRVLNENGLVAHWDGNVKKKIEIPEVSWKRRQAN